MPMVFLLAAVLFPVLALAAPVAAPAPSAFVDTEATTNVVFDASDAEAQVFSLSLALDAVSTNALIVAFGVDVNTNGVLERAETDFVLGWDSGSWVYRDRRAEVERAAPRTSGQNRLDCRLSLSAQRDARHLLSCDRHGAVFPDSVPRTAFDAEWNLMRVTARGFADPRGVLVTRLLKIGFQVEVR